MERGQRCKFDLNYLTCSTFWSSSQQNTIYAEKTNANCRTVREVLN